MVEFTKVVQIGWCEDGNGCAMPHFRELAEGEPAEPQTPYSCPSPDEWVDALLRDMPNASILYRDRLGKWFKACWSDGYHSIMLDYDR